MSATLHAQKLMLVRGERCLFRNVEFTLNSGELLLLEGRNGSGKTSLLKAVVGQLPLERGHFEWNGEPVRQQRQAFAAATAWLAHRSGLKPDLTPIENLRFELALRPVKTRDVEEVLERLGVLKLRKLPVRALSAGQQRRVAFARLLLAAAPLWLLDEPYTNLDRDGRKLVTGIIAEHLGNGGLCILAAHQDVKVEATTHRLGLS